jgi:DNA-binding NarL/FixJ family response regulator
MTAVVNNIKLTSRQNQVLTLVCHRGISNKAIAKILEISESTVKIHISAILKKYGVRNRTQLALAFNNDLKA